MEDNVIGTISTELVLSVVFVSKKHSLRVCANYRELTGSTVCNAHPTPERDDYIDSLGMTTVFSTMMSRNGFHHIVMNDKGMEKVAFVTYNGPYRYARMPFISDNVPVTIFRGAGVHLRHRL